MEGGPLLGELPKGGDEYCTASSLLYSERDFRWSVKLNTETSMAIILVFDTCLVKSLFRFV